MKLKENLAVIASGVYIATRAPRGELGAVDEVVDNVEEVVNQGEHQVPQPALVIEEPKISFPRRDSYRPNIDPKGKKVRGRNGPWLQT